MNNLREFVAAIMENGGATFNIGTGVGPTEGFVVSEEGYESRYTLMYPDKKFSVFKRLEIEVEIEFYIKKYGLELSIPENHLGGWMDGDDLVLDISRVYDCETKARLMAEKNNQDAYYNLNDGHEVRIR